MDLGFTRLDAACADVTPIRLDYLRLIAGLSAMQAASRTAAVEARLRAGTFAGTQPAMAMVELLAGGPGWIDAVITLRGSFHAETALRCADSATRCGITSLFTSQG